MNSPQQRHEVRLRGLSVTGGRHAAGPASCTAWFSPLSATRADALLAFADVRLYAAKHAKRNGVCA
jgi:GGDEF domain-containing protein